MYKEKFIAGNFPFTKAELVELRKSGQFCEGADYVKKIRNNGVAVVLWTETGLERLLATKGASFNGRKSDLHDGGSRNLLHWHQQRQHIERHHAGGYIGHQIGRAHV